MASGKAKDVDEMTFMELCEMMKALGLSDEGVMELTDARSLIKTTIKAEKTTNWSPGKAFTIVSKAKEDYDRKRDKLLESYTKSEALLTEACKELPVLQKFFDNFEKRIEHLKQREYFLFVTGETSAGKSLLINLFLGEEILPSAHTRVTSTICEIRYGEQRRIKAYFKSEDPETGQPTKEISLEPPSGSSEQNYVEQISPFISENASLCKRIELFWPHPLLQKGIVIVDSPGVGESKELDDVVYQHLPKVFAFIFVLSAANSDGIKKDTIRKLFEMVMNVFRVLKQETRENLATAFPIEEGMCEMTHVLQEYLLTKCALFVSNKWDEVPKGEFQNVKEVSIRKLKEIWPGFDPKSQLICMSGKYARVAQQYNVVTEDFNSLMNGMDGLITKCINARLELNWRWLNDVLSVMIAETKTFLKTYSSKLENVTEEIKNLNDALEYIKNHKDEIMKGLYKRFEDFEHEALNRMCEYLSSEDVKFRFTSWTEEEVPQEDNDWEETKQNIERAFQSRLQETLQYWLEDGMLLATAKDFVHEELKKYFSQPEDHLKCLPDFPDDNEGEKRNSPWYRYFKKAESGSHEELIIGGIFAFFTVIAWLIPIPSLAIRLVVAVQPAFSLLLNVIERLTARWEKSKFQNGKEAFMSAHSKNFLAAAKNRNVLQNFVKLQLRPVKQYLVKVGAYFSTFIPVKKKQLLQIKNKERSLEEVKNAYWKIYKDGCRLRGHHAVSGVTEIFPLRISCKALKWKGDISFSIGSGTFGGVYQEKMTIEEESKTVALKVCKKELNAENASEIMDEIELLRKLNDHRHILQFYGISLHQNHVVLVFEKCIGSLADYIFKDENKKSVSTKSKKQFVRLSFQWAREITDGLAFIHALKVMHRDLKPENILLSEENLTKIAGLTKPVEVITGTVAGTYFYMAPEVFDSEKYDEKADIYSLGIVLWEMWYGQRAYQWPGTVQEFFVWLKDGNRPVHKSSSDKPPWKNLMMQCWDGNPETRPTAQACKDEIKRVCIPKKVV